MRSLLMLSALALASLSMALGIGDKAPALRPQAVVKGTAVDLSKGLHVVEFWSPDSDASTASIPRLNELAKRYKGRVGFTGVAIWGEGPGALEGVKKFVAEQGPKMEYNVAFDGETGTVDETFLKPFGQDDIPVAYLVKDGTVLWIGHPMGDLDKAIDATLKGRYDLAAAKAAFAKQTADKATAQAADAKKTAEIKALMQPVVEAMQDGDLDGALVEINKIEAKRPDLKPELNGVRFSILVGSGSPKLLTFAKEIVTEEFKDKPEALNSMAWAIVDPEGKFPNPNYDAALVLAKGAADASKMKDGMILDTYALALFKTGDKKKAVEVQTKAVELSKTDKRVDATTLKEMQARLEQFKKANA